MSLANAFLKNRSDFKKEPRFPLAVAGCPDCGLVQLTETVPPEQLYRNYLYVSSTSDAVRVYASTLAARICARYRLGPEDRVAELGSNDGLILKAFQGLGTQVLGIEPARNLARIAQARGVPTVSEFFCAKTVRKILSGKEKGKQARVLLGRHVFAHIDDWHDFMAAADHFLTPDGVLLIEVPYLKNLLEADEFDTIYHEHLSYIALAPIARLAEMTGFQLIEAEPVALHGGSILMTLQRKGSGRPTSNLKTLLAAERKLKLTDPAAFNRFAGRVRRWKGRFESLVQRIAESGGRLAGYGAAAKANTLLNFCPEAAARLVCVLDRSPHKQGLWTPGTHLPVRSPEGWNPNGITHLVILAWNFQEEIVRQMESFRAGGGRFLIPIPAPRVI